MEEITSDKIPVQIPEPDQQAPARESAREPRQNLAESEQPLAREPRQDFRESEQTPSPECERETEPKQESAGEGVQKMGQDLAEDSPAQEDPKQTKKQLILELLRFLIVGGTATVFDYAVAYLFYQWLLPPRVVGGTLSLVISTALGFCVGLIVNWILSVKFVFKDVKNKKESRSKKSFVIFTIIGVIGLGITELGMHLGVSFLPDVTLFSSQTFLGTEWKWWIMKVIMTCIVLVWNYVGRKLLIFK